MNAAGLHSTTVQRRCWIRHSAICFMLAVVGFAPTASATCVIDEYCAPLSQVDDLDDVRTPVDRGEEEARALYRLQRQGYDAYMGGDYAASHRFYAEALLEKPEDRRALRNYCASGLAVVDELLARATVSDSADMVDTLTRDCAADPEVLSALETRRNWLDTRQ